MKKAGKRFSLRGVQGIVLVSFLILLGGCSAVSSRTSAAGELDREILISSRWPHTQERGVYEARLEDSVEVLWRVAWTTRVQEEKGRRWLQIDEDGKGQPWEYEQPVTWKKQMRFELLEPIQFRTLETTRRTLSGQIYNQQSYNVDLRQERIFFAGVDPKGKETKHQLKWRPGVIPKEFMFHWTRLLDYTKRKPGECYLLVSPTRLVKMETEIEGREVITTPAGRFDCYELELEPELGLLKFTPAQLLVPEMTLWCTVESPHYWVRYKGPVGGAGSPTAVIELVDFQQG